MSQQAIRLLIQSQRQLLSAIEAMIGQSSSAAVQGTEAAAGEQVPNGHFISEEEDARIGQTIELERQLMEREWMAEKASRDGMVEIFKEDEIDAPSPPLQNYMKRHGADPLSPGSVQAAREDMAYELGNAP